MIRSFRRQGYATGFSVVEIVRIALGKQSSVSLAGHSLQVSVESLFVEDGVDVQ